MRKVAKQKFCTKFCTSSPSREIVNFQNVLQDFLESEQCYASKIEIIPLDLCCNSAEY